MLIHSLIMQEYKHWNKWMLLDVNNKSFHEDWGKNVNIKMSSDLTLAIGNKDSSISLYDVFDPSFKIQRKFVKIGLWKANEKKFNCNFMTSASFYERRKNMSGVVIKVAFLVTNNFTGPLNEYLKDRHNKNQDSIGKFNFQLFEDVIEEFNFT